MEIIKRVLSLAIHQPIGNIRVYPVSGGSINQTLKIELEGCGFFFCKMNKKGDLPGLFEKEKNGLRFLAEQQIIKTPEIIAYQMIDEMEVLVMEWIDHKSADEKCWTRFGEGLAGLHRVTQADFGFAEDNYMGALPQSNQPSADWIDFFIHQRLEPQLRMAIQKNLCEPASVRKFERLYAKLGDIFTKEAPALLHGDLWSGNFICRPDSEPVLIDPAVYFGNRSMDLGMTTLFGGFGKRFYESYAYHYPLPVNHKEQWQIANLYPLLIHLNLFGKSYLGSIMDTIKPF